MPAHPSPSKRSRYGGAVVAYAFVGSLQDAAATGSATTIALSSMVIGTGEILRIPVAWSSSGGSSVSSISDGTNTYSRVTGPFYNATDPYAYEVWEAKNVTGGTYTLTVTFSGSYSYRFLGVARYSGLDVTASAQSVRQYQANAATSTDAVTSTTLTPSSQPGMLWGFCLDTTNRTLTAGTGFTSRGNFTNLTSTLGLKGQVEDMSISSTDPVAATFTINNSTNRCQTFGIYTLEDTGGGATGQPIAKRFGGVPGMGRGQSFGSSTWKRSIGGIFLPERKFA